MQSGAVAGVGTSGSGRRRGWIVLVAAGATLAWGGPGEGARPRPGPPAASYYTVRPDDPRAVVVERGSGGAAGDGIADDRAALQKAVDTVQETTGEGVV